MEKGILGTVLTVTIAVICVATILVPTLTDATETEKTFTNDGYFRLSHYDDTTDHTVTWSYEKPNVITVDNVDIPIDYDVPNGQVTIIADTNWIFRLYNDASGETSYVGMISATSGTTTASVSSEQTATISLTSGTMSATIGTTSKSGTYTDVWIPSADGEFTMKKYDKTAYVNGDSQLIAYGLTRVTNAAGNLTSTPGFGISLIGTYDDGVTGTVWRGESTLTIDNGTVNAEENSRYIDLYELESITATATLTETVDDETVTTDTQITYNYLLVPYEVTAEKSQHMTDAQNNIIMVIPVLMICAILITAVGMLYFRNKD